MWGIIFHTFSPRIVEKFRKLKENFVRREDAKCFLMRIVNEIRQSDASSNCSRKLGFVSSSHYEKIRSRQVRQITLSKSLVNMKMVKFTCFVMLISVISFRLGKRMTPPVIFLLFLTCHKKSFTITLRISLIIHFCT